MGVERYWSALEAGGPAGGRGKTGKERQSHNLLLLLNVMASSLEEFVDYHFTDDVFYHDGWKKYVAPQCRGK